MRDAERIDDYVPNFKTRAGHENTAIEPGLKLPFDLLLRIAIAIDRDIQLGAKAGEPADMIRVLVRHQNAGQSFRSPPDAGHSLPNLPQAEPRIDEQAGFISFHVRAIPGRTAAEDG